MKLISVVLLNWNGGAYLGECLNSIRRQVDASFELIIVDNRSTDGSLEIAKACEIERKTIIEAPGNLGFAKGMNSGIERTNGDLVVLLNLDVVLDSHFLSKCRESFDSEPGLGMLGGREYAWENGVLSEKTVSSGGFFLKRRIQGNTNVKKGDGYCFGPHGSFPCVRKSALLDSYRVWGYFYDPKFGTGWEDMDLWYRLHLMGWRCRYRDDLMAWHVGSSSADNKKKLIEKSLDYQQRIFRNRWFFIIKNLHGSILLSLVPFILLAELALVPYYLMVSPRSLRPMLGAYGDIIACCRALMRDRRNGFVSATASTAEMKRMFFGF